MDIKLLIRRKQGRIIKMINKIIYGDLKYKIKDKYKYKEFSTAKECEKWGNEHYFHWANMYKEAMEQVMKMKSDSSLETGPIECYCGYSYREINGFLRSGNCSNKELCSKIADILIILLCLAPKIPDDIVVYRVVNNAFIKELIRKNKLIKPEPIQEKGFMSTSLLKNIVNTYGAKTGFCYLLKIYVPKDAVGIYVNSITKRDEEEILLAPNSFLRLIEYPYYDKIYNAKIFECQFIDLV